MFYVLTTREFFTQWRPICALSEPKGTNIKFERQNLVHNTTFIRNQSRYVCTSITDYETVYRRDTTPVLQSSLFYEIAVKVLKSPVF